MRFVSLFGIDKKSLFGIPRSASAHTGRKHAVPVWSSNIMGRSMAETGGNVNPTA